MGKYEICVCNKFQFDAYLMERSRVTVDNYSSFATVTTLTLIDLVTSMLGNKWMRLKQITSAKYVTYVSDVSPILYLICD
jgi:hypothetical protein